MNKHLVSGGDWFGNCQIEHEEDFAVVRSAVLMATKQNLFHLSSRGKLNANNNKRLLYTVLPQCGLGTEKRVCSPDTFHTWPWVGVPAKRTINAKCHGVPEMETLAQWKLDWSQTHLA